MSLPPGARRLDVAEVRRAFAAGTLGTVGDDAGREHVERDGVAPDAHRAYGDPVDAAAHAASLLYSEKMRNLVRGLPGVEAEAVRRDRLARWQVPRV